MNVITLSVSRPQTSFETMLSRAYTSIFAPLCSKIITVKNIVHSIAKDTKNVYSTKRSFNVILSSKLLDNLIDSRQRKWRLWQFTFYAISLYFSLLFSGSFMNLRLFKCNLTVMTEIGWSCLTWRVVCPFKSNCLPLVLLSCCCFCEMPITFCCDFHAVFLDLYVCSSLSSLFVKRDWHTCQEPSWLSSLSNVFSAIQLFCEKKGTE